MLLLQSSLARSHDRCFGMASEATSLAAHEQLTSALESGEHTFLPDGYSDEDAQVAAKKTYTESSVLELSHFRISVTGAPVTTFGHQRALLNRMPASRLAPGAKYDASTYKPTFVHDTLALPGSLAQLLGKVSTISRSVAIAVLLTASRRRDRQRT